jgi:hypothetical protein
VEPLVGPPRAKDELRPPLGGVAAGAGPVRGAPSGGTRPTPPEISTNEGAPLPRAVPLPAVAVPPAALPDGAVHAQVD